MLLAPVGKNQLKIIGGRRVFNLRISSKCRHCGEFLDADMRRAAALRDRPWYFRTSFIVIAFCCVGPLALPLIWFRPRTPKAWKVALTILILLFSVLLFFGLWAAFENLKQYYELPGEF